LAKNVAVDSVTIASSGTTSTALTVPTNKRLLAIVTPSALTSTSITFEQSCDDGTTYTPVYNESTSYSLTVSTSRYNRVVGEVFDGVRIVRLVGGSAEGATRTIKLIFGES